MNLKNAAIVFSSFPLLFSAIVESLLRIVNSSDGHDQHGSAVADQKNTGDGGKDADTAARSRNLTASNHFRQLQHLA
ncbi:hypothetical protein MLD38_034644 [Melastoma candidum]|uniref:Uncharacterized protein n=1 Tax=Melastoma candidum TaxID=119954 RepID=A0ACB9MAB5_9MYRT|nr:hypothetical protein MLD38_034644 [Melastoma candidum]